MPASHQTSLSGDIQQLFKDQNQQDILVQPEHARVCQGPGYGAAMWQLTQWKQIAPQLSITSQQNKGNVRPKGQCCDCLQTRGTRPSHYCSLIGVFLGVRRAICSAFTSKDPHSNTPALFLTVCHCLLRLPFSLHL